MVSGTSERWFSGTTISRFFIALDVIGASLDVVVCRCTHVGMAENPLNHHWWNTEAIQISAGDSPSIGEGIEPLLFLARGREDTGITVIENSSAFLTNP